MNKISERSHIKPSARVLTNMGVLVCCSFPQAIEASLVALVITVGKVETSDAHSVLDETLKLVNIPASRSERANNLGLAVINFRFLGDLCQSNVGSAKLRSMAEILGLHDVVLVVECVVIIIYVQCWDIQHAPLF